MRVPAQVRADILEDPSPLRFSSVPFIALSAAVPPTAAAAVVTGSVVPGVLTALFTISAVIVAAHMI
jgi:hypothetical protein